MRKLEEQLKLAEEYGFREIVIPIEEARRALALMKAEEDYLGISQVCILKTHICPYQDK